MENSSRRSWIQQDITKRHSRRANSSQGCGIPTRVTVSCKPIGMNQHIPWHLSGGDRGKGEDQDLGTDRTAQPGSCLLQGLQAGKERGLFFPRSGHQLYINHDFVPATLPGPYFAEGKENCTFQPFKDALGPGPSSRAELWEQT